jgi:hypothetical protein
MGSKNIGLLFKSVLLTSFLLFRVASAGGRDSAGGNAVVCETKGKATSAEFLDLYEGRGLYGNRYSESSLLPLNQAREMAKKLDRAMGTYDVDNHRNFIEESVLRIYRTMHFLPSGTRLLPVKDSWHFVVPENCHVTQAAVYRPDDEIFVDSDLWRAMSPTSRAALLVHEALYYQLRFGADRTSERVRKAVSSIFSGVELSPRLTPARPSTAIQYCETHDAFEAGRPVTEFLAYMDTDGKLDLQFSRIMGYEMISRTWFHMDDGAHHWPIAPPPYSGIWVAGKTKSVIDAGFYAAIYTKDGRMWMRTRTPNLDDAEETIECRVD